MSSVVYYINSLYSVFALSISLPSIHLDPLAETNRLVPQLEQQIALAIWHISSKYFPFARPIHWPVLSDAAVILRTKCLPICVALTDESTRSPVSPPKHLSWRG